MTPEALARLHARCFTMPAPWSAVAFESFLLDHRVFLLGDARGVLLGRVVADEAELLTLAVPPEARRAGRATTLVTDFLQTAFVRGATTAFLEVAADNMAARALYAACGFAEAGRRPDYYRTQTGARVDALILRRALAAL